VNGDGAPDLITANVYDNTVTVLTNNGIGIFSSNATCNVGSYPEYVVAADIDGDGTPDLITANYGDNTLTILTNNGSGVFGFNATYNTDSGPVFVTAADVNGDGAPDLFSANYGGNSLTVLLNSGNPPKLQIQLANSHAVLISWLPAWPGYLLQNNSNLATTNWVNVINPGGKNHVTISPATGKNFYRLRYP
jgi:hypothetical protein